jgi:dolichol-phosphate mannosyltransferase
MEGWLILLVALGAMISLVFLAIGVVGVYAGKILIEVKQRPLYLVRDALNIETLSLVASEAS